MTRTLSACLTALAFATSAAAQGNLSTQGFGYPQGQLSSIAIALGGSTGELDPASALNPAGIALWGAPVLFMQYEPELRTVETEDGRARTTTARFPMVGISVPFGRRIAGSVSASTFLDRTWSSSTTSPQDIGGTVVETTDIFSSTGGITDFRVALAYTVTPRLQLGIAGHAFSGENQVTVAQRFPDTIRFAPTRQRSEISYGAFGASAGIVLRLASNIGFGASVRTGGDIDTQSGDTVLTTGKLPLRYGAGVTYTGISGVSLSARANFDEWSAMQPLRRPGSELRAYDAWDYGVGADVAGPTIGSRNIALRVGARRRGLPFGAGGISGGEPSRVNETALSGGVGIPLGVGRSQLDIGVARATRRAEDETAVGGARENAYIFSFGIRVRP